VSNEIHVISENDLQGVKKSGRRIRAVCHFHQRSRKDRDLSIAAWSPEMDEDEAKLAGWGHCHSVNCGVTVLVKEWNPRAAAYHGHSVETQQPSIKVSQQEKEQGDFYQRAQLAALNQLYPRVQRFTVVDKSDIFPMRLTVPLASPYPSF
jgi:plasmid stability protein